jgi:hypothetical protein
MAALVVSCPCKSKIVMKVYAYDVTVQFHYIRDFVLLRKILTELALYRDVQKLQFARKNKLTKGNVNQIKNKKICLSSGKFCNIKLKNGSHLMNKLKYVKLCFLFLHNFSFELRLCIPVRFIRMQEYLRSIQLWFPLSLTESISLCSGVMYRNNTVKNTTYCPRGDRIYLYITKN